MVGPMHLLRLFLILSIAVSFGFAQTAPKTSNQTSAGPHTPAISISPEEAMILMALLQSPVFKDNFIQSCTTQSEEWLGSSQANKSCKCAFNRLVGEKQFMSKLIGSVSMDGSGIDFQKWGYEVVAPCLPKDYPAETDNAFIKECLKQKDLDQATCGCVLNAVKKDYTVHSLIKRVFEDQKGLETDINLKTAQCLSK